MTSGFADTTDGIHSGDLASGVWAVMATPFTPDAARVDEESLSRLVDFYLALDIAGLTLLGVAGEALHLSPAERRRVVEVVSERPGVGDLVLGVTSRETEAVIAEIENVADVASHHAAGFMIQVNDPDPAVVIDHLHEIHARTGASVVLQDHPSATGVAIATDDLGRVIKACDFIVAVKLESAPSPLGVERVTALCDAPVFGGLGAVALLGELSCGSSGAMTGFSAPEGLIACCRNFASEGFEAAREAWLPYMPLVSFEHQPGIATYLRKEALRLRGLIDHATTRSEKVLPSPAMKDLVRRHLEATPVAVTTAE